MNTTLSSSRLAVHRIAPSYPELRNTAVRCSGTRFCRWLSRQRRGCKSHRSREQIAGATFNAHRIVKNRVQPGARRDLFCCRGSLVHQDGVAGLGHEVMLYSKHGGAGVTLRIVAATAPFRSPSTTPRVVDWFTTPRLVITVPPMRVQLDSDDASCA